MASRHHPGVRWFSTSPSGTPRREFTHARHGLPRDARTHERRTRASVTKRARRTERGGKAARERAWRGAGGEKPPGSITAARCSNAREEDASERNEASQANGARPAKRLAREPVGGPRGRSPPDQ